MWETEYNEANTWIFRHTCGMFLPGSPWPEKKRVYAQAASTFTGQNVGAKRYDNVKKIVNICVSCALVLGTVLGISLYLFGEPLLGIYITDSQQAVEYGLLRMQFVMIPYFTIAVMDVMGGVLRGMGASLSPMLITVLGVCGIRVGWIYTGYRWFQDSPVETRASMLFIVYPVSWLITATAQIIAYKIISKKKQRQLTEKQK